MARLSSSGSGERAGGSSRCGFRPGVQTRHGSRKAEDARKHFFYVGCVGVRGERATKGRLDEIALMRCLQPSVKHGKPRSRRDDHVNPFSLSGLPASSPLGRHWAGPASRLGSGRIRRCTSFTLRHPSLSLLSARHRSFRPLHKPQTSRYPRR